MAQVCAWAFIQTFPLPSHWHCLLITKPSTSKVEGAPSCGGYSRTLDRQQSPVTFQAHTPVPTWRCEALHQPATSDTVLVCDSLSGSCIVKLASNHALTALCCRAFHGLARFSAGLAATEIRPQVTTCPKSSYTHSIDTRRTHNREGVEVLGCWVSDTAL